MGIERGKGTKGMPGKRDGNRERKGGRREGKWKGIMGKRDGNRERKGGREERKWKGFRINLIFLFVSVKESHSLS